MKIIGLTGGVASGKNFVADVFKKNGAAIFDADEEVHKLLELDKSTFDAINKIFPEAVLNKKIDRKILGKIVFDDKKKLEILENILHQKVRKKYLEFLKSAQRKRKKLAVLNIPLLLEKQGYNCDQIISIITSPLMQKFRFLQRERKNNPKNFAKEIPSLEKKFTQIKAQQISNLERKKRSNFVIYNQSKSATINRIKKIILQK